MFASLCPTTFLQRQNKNVAHLQNYNVVQCCACVHMSQIKHGKQLSPIILDLLEHMYVNEVARLKNTDVITNCAVPLLPYDLIN